MLLSKISMTYWGWKIEDLLEKKPVKAPSAGIYQYMSSASSI